VKGEGEPPPKAVWMHQLPTIVHNGVSAPAQTFFKCQRMARDVEMGVVSAVV
jgi:hypothetical protein